jgi:hypothetical protein
LAGLLALAALTAVLLSPDLRSAAQDPLGIFRVRRFAVITMDPSNLPAMPQNPTALGSLTIDQAPTESLVASLSEAQAQVGFTLRTPSKLPAAFQAEPLIWVSQEGRFSYTFDAERVQTYLASSGATGTELPASLDGVKIEVTIPAHVVLEYRAVDGRPLILGQGQSPTIKVPEDLNVEQLRQQVLDLPGLPPELIVQLQAIEDWRHTAIIPVPRKHATSQEVSADGGKALLLEGTEAEGSALLWEREGIIYGLAGQLSPSELIALANSMTQ